MNPCSGTVQKGKDWIDEYESSIGMTDLIEDVEVEWFPKEDLECLFEVEKDKDGAWHERVKIP